MTNKHCSMIAISTDEACAIDGGLDGNSWAACYLGLSAARFVWGLYFIDSSQMCSAL